MLVECHPEKFSSARFVGVVGQKWPFVALTGSVGPEIYFISHQMFNDSHIQIAPSAEFVVINKITKFIPFVWEDAEDR